MERDGELLSFSDIYRQAAMANGYAMAESLDLVVKAVLASNTPLGRTITFPKIENLSS